MKKNIKLSVLISVSAIMAQAALAKCETQEKFKIVRTCSRVKAEVEKYDKIEQEAIEKLRPENWDELVKLERKIKETPDNATPEEKVLHDTAARKYNSEVRECLKPELEKEVEIEVDPLTEESLGRLMDSNDKWTVAGCEVIMNFFLEQ